LFVTADEEFVYMVTGPGDDEAGPTAQLLYAVDCADGSIAWASPVGGGSYHGRRLSVDGTDQLVVGSPFHGIRSYRVDDGTSLWQKAVRPLVGTTPATNRFGAYGRLVTHQSLVFIHTPRGGIGAVDLTTGELAWTRYLRPGLDAAAIVDGTLVFDEVLEDAATHRARGLQPDNGHDVFTVELGPVAAGRPVATSTVMYFPVFEHSRGHHTTLTLYAVNTDSGERHWRSTALEGIVDQVQLTLAMTDDRVVITTTDTDSPDFADTQVVVLSRADGTVLHRHSITDHAETTCTAETIYAAEEFSGAVKRFTLACLDASMSV
jgi:outer membrane protein assembly factor BamB